MALGDSQEIARERRVSYEVGNSWRTKVRAVLADVFGVEHAFTKGFDDILLAHVPLSIFGGASSTEDVQALNAAAAKAAVPHLESAIQYLEAIVSPEPASATHQPGKMPMNQHSRIFFSHSSLDIHIAQPFVREILEAGINVPHDRIFFSSSDDPVQRTAVGSYFIPHIREKIQQSSVLIAFVTPRFYASAFCMCELGAAWALLPTSAFIPILYETTYDDVRGILGGLDCPLLVPEKAKNVLSDLRDVLSSQLSIQPHSTSRWEATRDKFIERHI